jgi:hypothetical protein
MLFEGWVAATTLLAIVVGLCGVAIGYLFGQAKGCERGWLAHRRSTDPNVVGGFSEHPSVRKARERALVREALADMRAMTKHEREHWN